MRVRFVEVGRGKTTWTADLASVDERALIREIKARKVLASQNVSVSAGVIYVGGFRPVGHVEFMSEALRSLGAPPQLSVVRKEPESRFSFELAPSFECAAELAQKVATAEIVEYGICPGCGLRWLNDPGPDKRCAVCRGKGGAA